MNRTLTTTGAILTIIAIRFTLSLLVITSLYSFNATTDFFQLSLSLRWYEYLLIAALQLIISAPELTHVYRALYQHSIKFLKFDNAVAQSFKLFGTASLLLVPVAASTLFMNYSFSSFHISAVATVTIIAQLSYWLFMYGMIIMVDQNLKKQRS